MKTNIMNKRDKNNYILVVLIILSSCGFLNPFGLIDPAIGKFCFYLFTLIAWYRVIKHPSNDIPRYPQKEVKMIFFGIFTSIIMASVFHDQSFIVSIITTLPTLFAYSLFPILMRLKIPTDKIEKLVVLLVCFGMVAYIANFIAFPKAIFGEGLEEANDSRGIIRLGIPFLILFVYPFFLQLKKWMENKLKIRGMIWLSLLAIFIVLSVTRQIIVLSFVLGILMIMRTASLFKKMILVSFVLVFTIIILPQIPIYNAMMELTEDQMAKNNDDEDIRIKAWKFYTVEYQTNKLSPIFGNGYPNMERSKWGYYHFRKVKRVYGGNGCYTVDVGWAGFFWIYGAIATLGLLLLLIKSIRHKNLESKPHIKYWLLFILLTSVASGPILFHYQVVSISLILYLVYGSERKVTSSK